MAGRLGMGCNECSASQASRCQGVMHLLALVHMSRPHTALCAHCLLDPHAVL